MGQYLRRVIAKYVYSLTVAIEAADNDKSVRESASTKPNKKIES